MTTGHSVTPGPDRASKRLPVKPAMTALALARGRGPMRLAELEGDGVFVLDVVGTLFPER